MGARLLAILSAGIMLAACGNGLVQPTAGSATPGGHSSGRPSSPAQATQWSGSPPGSPSAAGRHCQAAPAPDISAGLLTGVQFVSAARGWVVGQDEILATTDSGRHWTVQDSGQLDLTSVDFIRGSGDYPAEE